MPTATAPYVSELDELPNRLDSWPYLRVERRSDCVVLRVRDLVVGTLNPVSRAVSVTVPPGAAWCGTIERFGPQLGAASP